MYVIINVPVRMSLTGRIDASELSHRKQESWGEGMDGRNFGDYIVFVDESGDQSLESVNASYPVFVLSFCIFEKTHYYTHVVPEVLRFKFDFFGSDIPILHEREIRKREGDFSILMRNDVRDEFFDRLNQIMVESEYTIVSSLIDKRKYSHFNVPDNPYSIGTKFGLERVFFELQERGQRGSRIPIIFESRGGNEDRILEREFESMVAQSNLTGLRDMFEFHCVSKKANLPGLQLVDLVARPIGVHYLHPDQRNRAWEMLLPKMRTSREGKLEGYGLKIYPQFDPLDQFASVLLDPKED